MLVFQAQTQNVLHNASITQTRYGFYVRDNSTRMILNGEECKTLLSPTNGTKAGVCLTGRTPSMCEAPSSILSPETLKNPTKITICIDKIL